MSDFTPDELLTMRVAMRSYMETMQTNAITFASDQDTSDYFASESANAKALFEKLVQMDLKSIHAARKAVADAVMKDDPDYREESVTGDGSVLNVKRQYNDRPMHGPF